MSNLKFERNLEENHAKGWSEMNGWFELSLELCYLS